MRRFVNFVLLVLLSVCALAQPVVDSEELFIKAAELTKLTAAVQALVRYEGVSDAMSEADVLRLATKHDPTLLAPFSAYRLRVLRQDRHASVLVCTADGSRGLLEDVGCTGRLDKHLWQSPKSEPCEFTLKISEVC